VATIRYYLNEHIASAVAEGPSRCGIKVLRVPVPEVPGATDEAYDVFYPRGKPDNRDP
jgi:hypothetical protein